MPNVTEIPANLFRDCLSSLVELNLPSIKIANFNLRNSRGAGVATKLKTVSLLAATEISDYTFFGCKSLANIEIPLVTSIGDHAFSGCSSLANIEIPLVTSIGDHAFS